MNCPVLQGIYRRFVRVTERPCTRLTKKFRKKSVNTTNHRKWRKTIDRPMRTCYLLQSRKQIDRDSEALMMTNLFLAELNMAVSIIGVLLVVVVPEIMLNVMPGKARQHADQHR